MSQSTRHLQQRRGPAAPRQPSGKGASRPVASHSVKSKKKKTSAPRKPRETSCEHIIYTDHEKRVLLQLYEKVLPTATEQWRLICLKFNNAVKRKNPVEYTSLRKLWRRMVTTARDKKTGDPNWKYIHRRVLEAEKDMEGRSAIQELYEESADEVSYVESDVSVSDVDVDLDDVDYDEDMEDIPVPESQAETQPPPSPIVFVPPSLPPESILSPSASPPPLDRPSQLQVFDASQQVVLESEAVQRQLEISTRTPGRPGVEDEMDYKHGPPRVVSANEKRANDMYILQQTHIAETGGVRNQPVPSHLIDRPVVPPTVVRNNKGTGTSKKVKKVKPPQMKPKSYEHLQNNLIDKGAQPKKVKHFISDAAAQRSKVENGIQEMKAMAQQKTDIMIKSQENNMGMFMTFLQQQAQQADRQMMMMMQNNNMMMAAIFGTGQNSVLKRKHSDIIKLEDSESDQA